jgi:hypothetical protein
VPDNFGINVSLRLELSLTHIKNNDTRRDRARDPQKNSGA